MTGTWGVRRSFIAGTLYGGLVGPAIGGLIYAGIDHLKSADIPDEFRIHGTLLVFPMMAVLLAGIPSAITGAIGGPWLAKVGRNVWLRMVLGAGMGLLATFLVTLIVSGKTGIVSVSGPLKEYGVSGTLSGMITASLFPVRWARDVSH